MIEIKNLRNSYMCEPYDFRVDRRTVVGNPYPMRYESERDTVCDMYEEYFKKVIVENVAFKKYIDMLVEAYKRYGKLRLFCWCAPKRCHAETIKKYIEKEVM